MIVDLIDSDFEGQFSDNKDCPIARCIKRYFKYEWVNVGCYDVDVGEGPCEYKTYLMKLPSQLIDDGWVGSMAIDNMKNNIIPRQAEIIGLEKE